MTNKHNKTGIRRRRRGNGKPPQSTCHENFMNKKFLFMNKNSLCIKRHKDMTLKDESPPPHMLVGVQCATGKEWRTTAKSSRKNEEAGPKQN